MKLTVLLLTVAFLQVNANGFSQTITYSGKNVPLEKIFAVIKQQAGFGFIYFDEQLKGAKKVTINVKNATVENVLAICMKDQPYDYTIKAKTIFIVNRQKKESADIKISTEQQKGKRINISGKVTGEQGEPVVGATITIKGTDVATSTNEKGVFYLNDVDEDAVLVVTYISYQAQEVALRGRNSLDVRLSVSAGSLDEAVVVAYNTTTRRMNTGSVTVVKGENIERLPNRSFDRSLQGLVPGLLISSGNGQPGGGVSNMVLRGIATGTDAGFGSTVRNPLIVIDGIPVSQDFFQITIATSSTPITNPLAQINPSDIETITVLKDASAIALYGSKASNGVILVTTKKGKLGKSTIGFRHQTDVATRAKDKVKVLNQEEYLELLFETYKNSPRSPSPWTDELILADLRSKFPTMADGSFYSAADWYKELFTDRAVTVANEISMSGAKENNNYYLNTEFSDQKGIVIGTGYKRMSMRFNFESKPTRWLKLGTNTTLSYNKQNYVSYTESGGNSYGLARIMSPLNPVYSSDGAYVLNYSYGSTAGVATPIMNPVAANDYNINRSVSYRGLSKFYAEIDFFKYFKFTPSLGVDFMLSETKEKKDIRFWNGTTPPGKGEIQDYDLRRANVISTNLLRYDRQLANKHTLNLLAGHEAQILTQKRLLLKTQGFRLSYYDQVGLGDSVASYSGSDFKETLLSVFGQANYSFARKIFLSASLRRDGSSKFGDHRKFGTYWSAGAGWVISQEPFMKNTSAFIEFLKIRGSIGVSGSSAAISRYTRYDQLSVSNYLNNTAVYNSLQSPGNPNIQWEETFNWDGGLEAVFLKERIRLTADVYSRKTSNLIYETSLAPTSGSVEVLYNIGDMKNSGVEFSLMANVVRKKDFKWNLNVNWSANRNRLIKQNLPLTSSGNFVNKEGENFNSFYLVRWAGVDPADGKPQWLDTTGETTKTYNVANRVIAGKPQPDWFGSIISSFNYKEYELSLFFNYKYGFQVFDGLSSIMVTDGFYPYVNQSKDALDRWQKVGDIAANPKRVLNNTDNARRASTRYLLDGDYIRLETVSLAYNFPKRITNSLKLSHLRVYLMANNVALWTKSNGSDPDLISVAGSVDLPYPKQRSVSVGLNINF